MADLLLELFSEEIPARMQADAQQHWQSQLQAALGATSLTAYSTPRRIAVWVKDLPEKQADLSAELKGPKVGAPDAAVQGFLKKTGLTLEQLEQRDSVYFATVHQKGRPTAEVLKEAIEKILSEFPWPKSMRWGSGSTSWVRPLHSILCIFGGEVVPVEFAGITAGNTTRGHRFLAPDAITISDASHYEAALEKAYVIASRAKRKEKIKSSTEALVAKEGLVLKEDAGLLEEVTGLVEWPTPLLGKIDDTFMDLPPEVLISEMRAHQKYFALLNKDGTFSNRFVITSNMVAADGGKNIIAGNERVLRARFADGRFFWDSDRKKKLADWAKGLETVTYHAKLGTIAEKVARVSKLAGELSANVKGADKAKVERAAALAKADLVTGMVGEFPELQGVMGRYYAQQQSEPKEVADAIRDHYLPLGPDSPVPTEPTAICVALADKIDTLTGMFATGERPTGSKDPFALRRAALGVIRIVLENNIRLNLREFLEDAPVTTVALHMAHEKLARKTDAKLADPNIKDLKVGKYLALNESAYEDFPDGACQRIAAELLAFITDRLKVQLKDKGVRHDLIAAVSALGEDDLVRLTARVNALQTLLASEDGVNLLAAYKRAANILRIEEKKDGKTYAPAPEASKLAAAEEKTLFESLAKTLPMVKTALTNEDFAGAMKQVAALRAPVDAFFDKVTVNADDANLRVNRLMLLAQIRTTLDEIANFALIEG